MSASLYNRDILRLAASLKIDDRLDEPAGVAEARSPICGSRILAEVNITDDGQIADLALRANACAIGQASATILRQHGVGETVDSLQNIRSAIVAALQGNGEMPLIWPELALLAHARDYPARHAAILLPYDALIAAIGYAQSPGEDP